MTEDEELQALDDAEVDESEIYTLRAEVDTLRREKGALEQMLAITRQVTADAQEKAEHVFSTLLVVRKERDALQDDLKKRSQRPCWYCGAHPSGSSRR